jgi:predicted TIM-barrel fold metal-dependent hydrolase
VDHAQEVGRYLRAHHNLYADLGALEPEGAPLEALVQAGGADSIMFGTDWPHFAQGPDMGRRLEAIRTPGRFTEDEVDLLLGQTALDFVRHRDPGLRAQQ